MDADEPFDERSYLIAIGIELRRVRRLRGFSREALAEAAGVHPNTVGIIERGERDISVITQKRILAALGCVSLQMQKDGVIIVLDETIPGAPQTEIQMMSESAVIEIMGKAIHNARELSGMSLEELSRRAGVHRNSLWNFEHGLVVPSCMVVYRLYRALGIQRVTPSELGVGVDY